MTSEATVSRAIAALAKDAGKVERAVAAARRAARAVVWERAGERAPNRQASAANPLVVDLDATIVVAHSEKEAAAPKFKKTIGFHPLVAFLDHGDGGTGEPLTMLLRKGNAGLNTAADHISVARAALAALPGIDASRPGKKVLFHTDRAGHTHDFLDWLHARGVQYAVGFTLPATMPELYRRVPQWCWQAALDADGEAREGAGLVEVTDLLAGAGLLKGYPQRMRVIVRRERPHPGAQLRFDDVDGYQLTAFATNTPRGQLQLRHRRRARVEDRIRIAKDTGQANLPLHGFDQNRLWLVVVQLALDLTAWTQLIALHDTHAGRWEPKRLRLRIFSIAATLARRGRRLLLHIKATAPWADLVVTAHARLTAAPP